MSIGETAHMQAISPRHLGDGSRVRRDKCLEIYVGGALPAHPTGPVNNPFPGIPAEDAYAPCQL